MSAHLDARGGPLDPTEGPNSPRWFALDQLLDGNGAILRNIHERLMAEEELSARAAATYLAGWIGGALADAIGFALATSGTGFLMTARSARWHQHPGGWRDRVDLGDPRVVIAVGHEWSGHTDVDTVGDPELVRELTVLGTRRSGHAHHRLLPLVDPGGLPVLPRTVSSRDRGDPHHAESTVWRGNLHHYTHLPT